MSSDLTLIALAAVVTSASWWDLRERRIPDGLTLGAIGLAFLLRAPGGVDSVLLGFAGFAIAVALALPLYLAGGMGGGDVKLLGAVGVFLGAGRIVPALLATAVAGGVLAVVVAARHGALRESFGRAASLARRWVGAGRGSPPRTLDSPGVLAIPYAVPIALGALAGWWA